MLAFDARYGAAKLALNCELRVEAKRAPPVYVSVLGGNGAQAWELLRFNLVIRARLRRRKRANLSVDLETWLILQKCADLCESFNDLF